MLTTEVFVIDTARPPLRAKAARDDAVARFGWTASSPSAMLP
jgi:hypothetical protein